MTLNDLKVQVSYTSSCIYIKFGLMLTQFDSIERANDLRPPHILYLSHNVYFTKDNFFWAA